MAREAEFLVEHLQTPSTPSESTHLPGPPSWSLSDAGPSGTCRAWAEGLCELLHHREDQDPGRALRAGARRSALGSACICGAQARRRLQALQAQAPVSRVWPRKVTGGVPGPAVSLFSTGGSSPGASSNHS